MYSRISFGRVIKIALLVGLLYNVFLFIRFGINQAGFQKFLASHFITWDDLPAKYADVLRTKDAAKIEQFDYASTFPKADPDPSARIPNIIHFIWFVNEYHDHLDVTEMPTKGTAAPRECTERNPGWTVNIWNSTAARKLIEDHYDWFIPIYDSYRYPIQRIDAFKYFVLWHYGGVYMDMDISCRRPLEPLAHFPAWWPEASPLGINNDLMAARARHPLVERMVLTLGQRNRNLFFPYLTIYWSTGPQFTSDTLKYWWLEHPKSEDQTKEDAWLVLPREFYSEEYTFFGHMAGGSWHGSDVAVILWFVAHPLAIALIVTLVLAACVGCCVSRRRQAAQSARKERSDDLTETEMLVRSQS